MKECQIYHQYFRCFSRKLQLVFLSPSDDWLVWPSDKVFSGNENHNSSSSTRWAKPPCKPYWQMSILIVLRHEWVQFLKVCLFQTEMMLQYLIVANCWLVTFSDCYWLKEVLVGLVVAKAKVAEKGGRRVTEVYLLKLCYLKVYSSDCYWL